MRRRNPATKSKIKEFCEQYYLRTGGKSPNVRQIAEEIGVHFSTVSRYLIDMDDEGMIRLDNGVIRTDVTDKMVPNVSGISVSGSIPCGEAVDELEEITDYIALPEIFLDGGKKDDYFILVTHGDSMVDAGIDPGDYVILRRTTVVHDGEIVAALMDEQNSTLKRYCEVDGEAFLWAENEAWDMERRYIPLGYGDSIQGVAVTVVKQAARKRLEPDDLERLRKYRDDR